MTEYDLDNPPSSLSHVEQCVVALLDGRIAFGHISCLVELKVYGNA